MFYQLLILILHSNLLFTRFHHFLLKESHFVRFYSVVDPHSMAAYLLVLELLVISHCPHQQIKFAKLIYTTVFQIFQYSENSPDFFSCWLETLTQFTSSTETISWSIRWVDEQKINQQLSRLLIKLISSEKANMRVLAFQMWAVYSFLC